MAGKVYVITNGNLVREPKEAKGFVFFTIASSQGKGKETTYTDCAASQWYAKMILEHMEQYTKGRHLLISGTQTDHEDEYQGQKRRKKTVWLNDLPQFLDWPKAGTRSDLNEIEGGDYGDDPDLPF